MLQSTCRGSASLAGMVVTEARMSWDVSLLSINFTHLRKQQTAKGKDLVNLAMTLTRLLVQHLHHRFTDLRCWWDSTRKQRYRFSQRSEVRKTLDAWLFKSLHTTGEENLTVWHLLNITQRGHQPQCRKHLTPQPTHYREFRSVSK